MSEEDMTQAIMALRKYSHKDEWLTKYQACQFLNGISRSKFDSLVADGEIPKGQKNFAGDSSLFWKTTDLMEYRKRKQQKASK
jgi:predicted DNA-binding transcriptional regulator AlpA